jgi:hypothetical protein
LKLKYATQRDKMPVFVALVQKCLQHRHSCRLAGVWLKWQNLRSPVRWIDLFTKAKRRFGIYVFQLSYANIHPSISSFFSNFQCQSALGNATATDSNKAKLGDILTPCPAVHPRAPLVCTRKDDAKSYEVLCFSRKIMLANLKIWCFKMQPFSGNQRPDVVTSLMNMSRSLRLPREMHLSRSSSNVLRCRWNMWAMKMILNIFIDNSLLEGTPDSTTNQPKNSKNN